jgi:hypothetical protein
VSVEIRDYRRTPAGPYPGPGRHDGLLLYATGVPRTGASPDPALEDAVSALREAMAPHAMDCVLLNMLGDGDVGADRTHACFTDDDFARLQEVKRRYDPENRFRFNHNIAPGFAG